MAELRREIQKILDSTHDGMIAVDTDGIITVFNKSAERLTGISASDALGRYVEDVILNTRLPVVLKTGVSELNRQQPLRTTTIITNRMPVLDDSGTVIGAIAVFRDVSELIELAGQITNLSEITETLEATLNATQDAISVVDQNGRGILVNPAYLNMTGTQKSDLIGSTRLVEGDSVHRQVLMTKSPVKGARLKVGKQRKDVIAYAAPIIVNKQLRGSVEIIHDLTELNEIYRKLDQAKKIIRSLEAKYTFDDIVGSAPLFREAVEKAKLAASTPATVLITGESGTGKELFAHAIHNASDRRYGQFVRVNCAAINEN
ncbi:MAG: PAS domain-containing protein, partial [Bacillota bacterium]|nr:PAS domain-containing protein [Bacillota bacterium]